MKGGDDMMRDRYPDIALEEAEVLVDILGWADVMEAWAQGICQPLETMGKNRYIFGLMDALLHELDGYPPDEWTLTAEQRQGAERFLARVQGCERLEVVL
jgi:hypothetical protein